MWKLSEEKLNQIIKTNETYIYQEHIENCYHFACFYILENRRYVSQADLFNSIKRKAYFKQANKIYETGIRSSFNEKYKDVTSVFIDKFDWLSLEKIFKNLLLYQTKQKINELQRNINRINNLSEKIPCLMSKQKTEKNLTA